MEKVLKNNLTFKFNHKIYENEMPSAITGNLFWDGGITAESTLKDKQQFYFFTYNMSEIIKSIIKSTEESVYISQYFCEYNKIYADWSDLKEKELFCRVSGIIKKNSYYKLTLPQDSDMIDLIVESNFLYYTFISLYLPKINTVLLPTCHTEILVYSENYALIEDTIKKSIRDYKNIIKYIK